MVLAAPSGQFSQGSGLAATRPDQPDESKLPDMQMISAILSLGDHEEWKENDTVLNDGRTIVHGVHVSVVGNADQLRAMAHALAVAADQLDENAALARISDRVHANVDATDPL